MRVSPMIQIYDSSKEQLVKEYVLTYGAAIQVPYTLEPSTIYYLSVQPFWFQEVPSSSAYRLSIARIPDPA